MHIELKSISKRFGNFVALNNIDLEINSGELLALLGPSGSGKTTLLRIISGLEAPTSGVMLFDGKDIRNLKPSQRKIGFVFQHYALFKNMSIFENVAFGLNVKPCSQRPEKDEIKKRVMKLLELVQLEQFAKRYPSQLSGGQRQRVALVRALVIEPEILMLDEPFGALDAKVRMDLRRWLRNLHDEMKLTSLFVTHDQEEALELADRVVLMNNTVIEQVGTPQDVYDHPGSAFAYEFLGRLNRFDCVVENNKIHVCGLEIVIPGNVDDGSRVAAFVRPHDVQIFTEEGSVDHSAIIKYMTSAGPVAKIEMNFVESGTFIEAEVSRAIFHELGLSIGQKVYLKPRKARVFSV